MLILPRLPLVSLFQGHPWDGSVSAVHHMVLHVRVQALCDGVLDGPPADADRLPVCVVLRRLCPHHDILGRMGRDWGIGRCCGEAQRLLSL